MKSIFVVVGVTGEYSDRNEWYVVAYPDEKSANDHADAANLWLRENRMLRGQRD